MMRHLLPLLLLCPLAAFAGAPTPAPTVVGEVDPGVSALTDMQGRYTIGPWEGSIQGRSCVLTNSEPLNFADLELSAEQEQGSLTLRLTPAVAQPMGGQAVNLQVDSQPVGQLPYRDGANSFTVTVSSDLLAEMKAGTFLSIGNFRFDLHGFSRAFSLFEDCLKKALPVSLPYEQLVESEPSPVSGGWQMITIKLGEYRYAAYAMLGEGELGLWVHAGDRFVLSLSGLKDVTATMASLNGQEVYAVPQQDGALIALTPDLRQVLETSSRLSIKLGAFEKTYDIKDIRAVMAALQPYE